MADSDFNDGPNDSGDTLDEFDKALRALASPGETLEEAGGGYNDHEGFQPITIDEVPDRDEQIHDYLGFLHRANEARNLQRAARLITAEVTDQLGIADSRLPEIKKVTVPENSIKYIFSERHEPLRLPPGEHEVSRLGLGGGFGQSFKASTDYSSSGSFQEKSSVLVCDVATGTLPFTITLPDHAGFYPPGTKNPRQSRNDPYLRRLQLIKQEEDQDHRLQNIESLANDLSRVFDEARLKTKEGICTGVRVQLDVKISDPKKLIDTYCRSYSRQLEKKYKDLDRRLGRTPVNPGLAQKLWFPMNFISRICFGARQDNGVPLQPVTLSMVYRRIRLEVADALRDAIRQQEAKVLIENPAHVREAVETALNEHVEQSLRLYGLTVSRVLSVECVSPEYNRMIIDRGRLTMREEKVKDAAKKSEIEAKELEIETKRFGDQVTHQNRRSRIATELQGETTRAQLHQFGKTQEEKDRIEAETMKRRLEREKAEAEHQRHLQQHEADMQIELEKKRLELQKTKLENAMQVNIQYEDAQHKRQQEALDAEHQRQQERLKLEFQQQMDANQAEMTQRLTFLEKFAGLSLGVDENKMLVMALANNPALAKPYVEATRAKGQEEMMEKMSEFKDQLVKAHGKQDKMIGQLWNEGIKQIGHVLGKHLEDAPKNNTNTYYQS